MMSAIDRLYASSSTKAVSLKLPRIIGATVAALMSLAVSSCGEGRDNGPVQVDMIGTSREIKAPLTYVDTRAGSMTYAATAQGLVTYDDNGTVVPGLAQRWIVDDDGKTYIFRLRRSRWANGTRVDARDVQKLMRKRLRAVLKQDPYGPLASISEIIAMTADVIEIRLKTSRPNFLLALAHPSMGIAMSDGGSGPYRKTMAKSGAGALRFTPVEDIAMPDREPAPREERIVHAERASKAIVRFRAGKSDLMLGATLAELPYIALADVDRDRVRFDAVQGLFGLALSPRTPLFDDPHVREALSMAVEREAIIAYFEMNRWKIASQMLPQQLDMTHPPTVPGWTRMTIEERRNLASGVITRWKAQHDDRTVKFSIALPEGPGMDLLFLALKVQFRAIDVEIERVEKNADMTLIDEVAPYESVSWYLGRLSCARNVRCDPEAEALLRASQDAVSIEERLVFLGQAEVLVQAYNGYIPLATPVRWSLVDPRLNGYAPSRRAHHDLRWLEK